MPLNPKAYMPESLDHPKPTTTPHPLHGPEIPEISPQNPPQTPKPPKP